LPDFADLINKLKSGWWPDRPGGPPRRRAKAASPATLEWQTTADRAHIDHLNHDYQYITWAWIKGQLSGPRPKNGRDGDPAEALGLALGPGAPATIYRSKRDGLPALEVHAVRSARRPLEDGRTIIDLVIEMTQRRRGYLDPDTQTRADSLPPDSPEWQKAELRPDFILRGGCTLLINGETGEVRYCVSKNIASPSRLARQRGFTSGGAGPSLRATYTPGTPGAPAAEPFALLHRSR
jgi:hypothetical protein